ncbi:hypothetical protein SMMN14_05403, partial [Sphaerulina musiva]
MSWKFATKCEMRSDAIMRLCDATPEQTARDVWITREQSGLRTQTAFRQPHMTPIYSSKEDEDNDGDNGDGDTKDDEDDTNPLVKGGGHRL